MIVYFADRNLNVLGTATTHLPEGIAITSDEKHEALETGVRTFNVTFVYDDDTRDLIENTIAVGNFLLRSADDENEFYTIITTDHDTQERTVAAYCEDAGLDLLNTMAPALENSTAHDAEWYINKYLPAGWEIGANELSGNATLSWDGESTVTERLLSIVGGFNGELDFSYEIEGLNVTKRFVNFYRFRGNSTSMFQLRLGGDIARIATKKSIEDLATAYIATGATPSGAKEPIKLFDGSYSSDGTTTHTPADPSDPYQVINQQVCCLPAMAKWSSALDSDGLLVRSYSYDTSNRKELFSHAVAELRKVVDEVTTYDIEFISFPKDARLGDRINVVDDEDHIYLEGRILELTKSVINSETTAVLGDFIIKSSGIAERLSQFAMDLKARQLATTVIDLTSSAGNVFTEELVSTTITVQVTYGETIITNQTELDEVFGSGTLTWYKDGTAITSTATHVISNNGFTLQLVNETVDDIANYEVKLIV